MEINTEKANNIIKSLRSLCHPVNREIITLLEKEKALDVNTIMNKIKLIQPVVSHYLIELKDRGVLVSERNKRRMIYSINPDFHKDLAEKMDKCITMQDPKYRTTLGNN